MWSENFPNAANRADEAINYSRSELDANIIDSCIDACQECWKELKDLAKERLSKPGIRRPVMKDAKRFVQALLDTIAGNNKKINQLFDYSETPEIPSEQEYHAKSFIGALVLKNGFDSNPPKKQKLRESANLDS